MIPYVNPINIFKQPDYVPGKILTCGPKVEEFEKLAARITGAKYAVACSSGTIALYCVYRVLRLKGKIIAMPSFTWRSTAEAALMAGAKIKFVDIQKKTLCIDPAKVGKCNAIVAVDCFGCPADYQALQKYNVPLVVDSAHSFGAKYRQQKIGKFGVHCYSFSPTKVVVAGEGGLITCNDKALSISLREMARWAGRMSEYHAACAIEGIKNLPSIFRTKRHFYKKYYLLAKEVGIKIQEVPPHSCSTFKDVILILQSKKHRNALREFLTANEVETKIYFSPAHTLRHFRQSQWDNLKNTMNIYDCSICIPSWPGMDQEYILELLKQFFAGGILCPVGTKRKMSIATG